MIKVIIQHLQEMLKQQYKIEKEAEHYHNDIYDVRVYKHLWQMPYVENKAYTDLSGDDMILVVYKKKKTKSLAKIGVILWK